MKLKLCFLSLLAFLVQACAWTSAVPKCLPTETLFVSEISEAANSNFFVQASGAISSLEGEFFWVAVRSKDGQVGVVFSQPLSFRERRHLKKSNRGSSWRARSPWDYFILAPGKVPKDESNFWMFPFKNPTDQEVGVLLMYRSFSPVDNDYGQPQWIVRGLEEYLGANVTLEQTFE